MNKILLTFGVAAIAISTTPTKAGDLFDSLDSVLSKVEKTMDTTDRTMSRAGSVQKRIADKVPSRKTTPEEEETLRKAQEIEERRILREAEAIRNR